MFDGYEKQFTNVEVKRRKRGKYFYTVMDMLGLSLLPQRGTRHIIILIPVLKQDNYCCFTGS